MWRSKRCYIVLLLFSTIFLGLFVRSSDASASSLSVSYSSGFVFGWNDPIFPSCTGSCLSNYSYLLIEPSSPAVNTSFIGFRLAPSNRPQDFRCYQSASCLFQLPSSPSILGWRGDSTTVPFDFTATLLDTSPFVPCDSPTGTLSITENGTFNVSSYEYAEVNVPAPPVVTPYDNKLDSLIQAVYVVAGTMLVIYFFYALYRIYMGGRT